LTVVSTTCKIYDTRRGWLPSGSGQRRPTSQGSTTTRIAQAAKEGDTAWLLVTMRAMATELDADTVQNLFQVEIDEGGYFEPCNEQA
jgi:hypothetical protein